MSPDTLRIPKRILIIGAGPAGLVGLRNLNERGKFEHVELWERRNDVGGAWYLDEPTPDASLKPRWPSPAYKGLIGNVLPQFLSFSEFPFLEPLSSPHQPFPSLVETYAYLRSFAEPYLKDERIKLNREVVRVLELESEKGWSVSYKDWNDNGKVVKKVWDAVVVAVGFYDNPVWPDTVGLEALKKNGLAKHARWYRGVEGFEGKKLLVIGNANSSNDVAAQLSLVSDGPVYQSIRRPAFPGFPSLASEHIKMVAPISEYILKDDKFDVVLTDGTTLRDFDHVHCGTGYRPLPQFIQVLNAERKHTPFTSDEVVPWRVPALHRLVMYAYNPSLAFLGAPVVYTPFTVADVVSTWLSLAWRGEVFYPDTHEGRLAYEKERLEVIEKRCSELDNPSSLMVFNVMGQDEQDYAASFREDVVKARPGLDKILPVWNDEKTLEREAMFTAKRCALEYTRDNLNGV